MSAGTTRVIAIGLLSCTLGCSATIVRPHVAAGEAPLCADVRSLGEVAVLVESAWRPDQKDVEERDRLAHEGVRRVFDDVACASRVEVLPLARWSSALEGDRLDELAEAGFETVVFVRIEELGPNVALTFSLPLLWIGNSEVQIRMRAVHIPTRSVLLDAGVARFRGGPFQLRPASWAQAELESALRELVGASVAERESGVAPPI